LPTVSEVKTTARKLVEGILGLRAKENLVIYSDPESDEGVVEATVEAASTLGATPILVRMPANHEPDHEYPPPLRQLLKNADAIVEMGGGSVIAYTSTYEEIRTAGKARFISLRDIESGPFVNSIGRIDIDKTLELGEKIVETSRGCREIRIRSARGTDIEARMNGRMAWQYPGIAERPGEEAVLAGQVWWVPDEETIHGKIVVDGTIEMPRLVRPRSSVTLKVEKGVITSVAGGSEANRFAQYLSSFNHPNMYRVAHLTLGINPGIRRLSRKCTIANERLFGAFVIGFGSQGDYGAKYLAPSHGDLVLLDPSLWLDGLQLEREGKLIHPDLARICSEMGMREYRSSR